MTLSIVSLSTFFSKRKWSAPHPGGIVAVAGAIPTEVSGIRRLGAFRRVTAGGFSYYKGDIHGKDVAVFVSGVGEASAYETAKAACRALPVSAYISIGLSASLLEGLKPGRLVVAESTASLADGKAYQSDGQLLSLARKTLEDLASFGPVATSGTVLTTSKSKKEAAASCGAVALDMETYGAARAAYEGGVPFLAIRAISDTLDEDLPADFNRFIRDGSLDWPRFILHVATHPGLIPGLIRLGKNSRLAARNLAGAVQEVVVEL